MYVATNFHSMVTFSQHFKQLPAYCNKDRQQPAWLICSHMRQHNSLTEFVDVPGPIEAGAFGSTLASLGMLAKICTRFVI